MPAGEARPRLPDLRPPCSWIPAFAGMTALRTAWSRTPKGGRRTPERNGFPDCYAVISFICRDKMTEEQEVAAIPLAEERVTVTKREVETGRLRIQVSVEERQDTVPV